jgi:hypothetical protein
MKMNEGEKAIVIARNGNIIGSGGGFMHRFCWSIAILKANGHLVYRGHTPYFLGSTGTFAKHYRSGLSKADAARCHEQLQELQEQADKYNQAREY